MNRKGRKIRNRVIVLFVLLIIASVCSAISESTEGIGPESGTCGPSLSWELSNGVLTITGTGAMADCSGGAPWEARKNGITSVIVQTGATSIGNYAFHGCANLAEVSLPETIQSVGHNSFSHCVNLETLDLPTGVTEIGEYAFWHCDKYKNVTLPATLTAIGRSAFGYCVALEEIQIPDSVISMGTYVFQDCHELKTVRLSGGMSQIPGNTFPWCYALTNVQIPEGITTIGESAFRYCHDMTEITLPGSIETIQASAFNGCTSLATVNYPKTRADAEKILFGTDNTAITSATWQCSDGTSQGMGASSGTCGPSLSWELSNGVLTITGTGAMADCSGGAPWEARKNGITSVIVQTGATSIGNYAFHGCANLAEVSLPETIQSVGHNSFSHCVNLETLDLPTGVTEIGEYAFWHCDKYKNVTLPATLTAIGRSAFGYCVALEEIQIPDSVISMGTYVFQDCHELKTVRLSGGMSQIPGNTFPWCYALTNVQIPEGITTIGESAFRYCHDMTEITLPGSIETIQASAFNGCTSLATVNYPKTRADAEKILFGTDNTAITSATWHFEYRMIPDLDDLKVLRLPAGLTEIEANAFEGLACEAVVVPDGCITIGARAFADCRELIYVILPSGTAVASDAFDGCPEDIMIDRQ